LTPAASVSPAPEAIPAGLSETGSTFGNVLSSKIGISLVACAITFILGSVALLAVLAMTKP
jgi:hypothetical protein